MANVKIKHDEFQAGFIRGIVVGLLTLLLAIVTFVGLPFLGHAPLVILLLTEWLVPAFFVYYEIRTNSGRIGLMASHYCIFIIVILLMLIHYYL
jgi:hypothetical protein